MRPNNRAAKTAVEFINNLTHTKGRWARQKFDLRPWQETIVRRLFGTLDRRGRRQYRTAFIFLPRKNGKTELCAAFALYSLIGMQEAGGEIYSAAVDREQASLVFNVAAGMIRNDPTLSRLCRITDSHRKAVFETTQSVYRAIPADAPHAHGYNASTVIYDEVHAAPNRDLWDVLSTSMGTREQPLMIGITTAGYDRDSLAYQLYEYATRVRDGIIEDPSFLPIIYEAPEDADWTDEAVWHLANPALGDFRSLEEMRIAFREAREVPAKETIFRQLYLNQWVESATRWMTSDVWDRCMVAVDPAELAGRECFAGLDLAYRDDFAALVLVFPIEDGTYRLLPRYWIPADGKRDVRQHPLAGWIAKGHVTVCPGNSTDFPTIRRDINELGQQYRIREIAVDPWNARQLAGELVEDGFEVFEFQQSMKNFNEPTKLFESLAKAGKINTACPVMRWMISNVVIEQDANGNYRPSKKKSSEKIDGAVAALMGLARAMQPIDEPGEPQLIILR